MAAQFRPMLACNAPTDLSTLRFPLLAQPKIDGVRALNLNGRLLGRSLKPFKNRFINQQLSNTCFDGLDGELIVWDNPTSPSLCRDTTSALNSIQGTPSCTWYIFDCFWHPYEEYNFRYWGGYEIIQHFANMPPVHVRMKRVPSTIVNSLEEVEDLETEWLAEGYEGIILRSPYAEYKYGRATIAEGSFLKIKRFTDSEAIVLELKEASQNYNIAQDNELGYTFRTSHADFKAPKGMIGAMLCQDILTKEKVLVSAGKLTHEERTHYFQNPNEILGQTITYRHFLYGKKDKARMATFQNFRMEEDIS